MVPVSLCRAGCGVSTTRDGVKFEFDEEEDIGSRNHGKLRCLSAKRLFNNCFNFSDAASVDAVSRIGATSIGEVSLSVASGSHLGAISQYTAFVQPSNRESTTALAGSITGYVTGVIIILYLADLTFKPSLLFVDIVWKFKLMLVHLRLKQHQL